MYKLEVQECYRLSMLALITGQILYIYREDHNLTVCATLHHLQVFKWSRRYRGRAKGQQERPFSYSYDKIGYKFISCTSLATFAHAYAHMCLFCLIVDCA